MSNELIQLSGERGGEGSISIAACPHPFRSERITRFAPEGLNVEQLLRSIQPDPVLLKNARVFIDGSLVARAHWRAVRPRAGAHVAIKVLPSGGGGDGQKVALRLVATLAIVAASIATGFLVAGAFTIPAGAAGAGTIPVAGQIWGGLASAVVGFGGTTALNALVKPPEPSEDRLGSGPPRSLSLIEGGRNAMQPFGTIPRPLGRIRMVPPFAAKPYTEVFGSNQYMRAIYCWGYGPLQLEDLKIGETPLEEFLDLEDEDEYVIHHGDSDDGPFEIYTNSIHEQALNVKLTNPSVEASEALEWAADGETRTTQPNTTQVILDFSFPGLFKFAGTGDHTNAEVELRVEWAPTGTTDWKPGTAGETFLASTVILPKKPKIGQLIIGRGLTLRKVWRVDLIMLNKFTGTVKVISSPVLGSDPSDVAKFAPVKPGSAWERLAYVKRDSDDSNTITSGMIVDARRTDAPFGDDDPDTAVGTDFQISAQGSPTNDRTVDIAAGDLFFDTAKLKSIAKTPDALIRSVRIVFDSADQYDVRVRRVTADATSSTRIDEVFWTRFRSVLDQTPIQTTKELCYLEMRVKATDRVNGVIDELNGVVTSEILDWNGSSWEVRPTNNPASIFREIMEGVANARAVATSRLDLTALQAWHADCGTSKWSFNRVIDYETSVRELLRDVCFAGRASPTLSDTTWSVVQDKTQSTPVQHFTPRNSYGFESSIAYPSLPHGFKVRFRNEEKDWRQDERIVYRDGYDSSNATEFEEIEFPGITHTDHIWEVARYLLAVATLRRERYSFYVDFEHLVCQRGDLIRFQHDVPQFGLASGRVSAIQTSGADTTGVTVDEPIPMAAGTTYVMRFRMSDNTSQEVTLVTDPGTQSTVVFDTPITTSGGPQVGDLFGSGPTTSSMVEMLVVAIEPGRDLAARLTLVDYAPAVYTADAGPIPAFDSQIAIPPGREIPFVENVRSNEEVLAREADGSLRSRVMITLGHVTNAPLEAATVHAVYRPTGTTSDFKEAPTVSRSSVQVELPDVEDGVEYEFKLRYGYPNGRFGEFSPLSVHTVVGKTSAPSDVTNFGHVLRSNSIELCWDQIPDRDRDEYEIREGASWGAGTFVARVSALCHVVDSFVGSKTYQIKAIDSTGNESANATSLALTVVAPGTPTISATFDGSDLVLSWTATAGTFPISHYEVRYGGANWAAATVYDATVLARTVRIPVTWTGARTWRVEAVGNGGSSSDGAVVATVTAPVLATFTATPIDNLVVLDWSVSTKTLPVAEYIIKRESTEILRVTGTAFTQAEPDGGTFNYEVVPVDSAGNEGTGITRVVKVDAPSDFVQIARFESDLDGTRSDLWQKATDDPGDGTPYLCGPTVTFRQYQAHFSTNSWTTWQAAITAGYPYFGQDATNDEAASYEEELDIGSVVSAGRVVVTFTLTNLNGTCTATVTISTKENSGDAWTDHAAGDSDIFTTTFRYVKVAIAVDSDTDDEDFSQITDLLTVVRAKEITDQGSTTVSGTGGTTVTFNKTFTSIEAFAPIVDGTGSNYATGERVSATSYKVRIFNSSDVEQSSGTVRWIARGY